MMGEGGYDDAVDDERVPDTLRAPSLYDRSMAATKTRHFIDILRETGDNRSKTARILGVDRRTVIRWIAQLKKEGFIT